MNADSPSYNILISPDETVLLNAGKSVSLYRITENGICGLNQVRSLKHPSRIALSSSGTMFAYSNTSGHIAVHDIKTGELLVKSDCLSKEGFGLYFVNNDMEILSSEWGGSVFTMTLGSGKTSIVGNYPVNHATNLVPINSDNFLVIGSVSGGGTLAFDTQANESVSTPLFSTYPYWLECSSFACAENEVFFYGHHANNSSDKWINEDVAVNALFSYDMLAKRLINIISIQDILGTSGSMHTKFGYFTCMCISKNKQYVLIGYSSAVLVIDLLSKRHISTRKIKHLSSLHFLKSDTKVVMGTWENIQIVDFQDLC